MALDNSDGMRATVEQLKQKLEQMQRWAQDNEERVRTLVYALPVGLFITEESGMIEAANPHCLLLFAGKDPTSFLDKNVGSFFRETASGAPLVVNTSRADGKTHEAIAIKFNGDRFPADVLICPFSTKTKKQLLVVVEDVTQRHEVERLKQEFVSMISHDLRTPLTSIQCYLTSITEGLYDNKFDVMKGKARYIESDTSRLIAMINSLLDIDKLEAGKLDMYFDVIPCHEIVEGSVQSVMSLAEQRHIALEIAPIDRMLHVRADKDFAVQVAVNLLSNALKFSPRESTVRIECRTENEFIKLLVCDQGPGITQEFRQRMFNRFEQAQMSDARVKGGSGLGLASAKAIVEQHGGQIGVDSREGRGSTFWFTLPRVVL